MPFAACRQSVEHPHLAANKARCQPSARPFIQLSVRHARACRTEIPFVTLGGDHELECAALPTKIISVKQACSCWQGVP
jgi:hypothetical protein